MKNRLRKCIAGVCIVFGIAVMAVPFYYHFHGANETDKLMEQFEKTLEDTEHETGEPETKESGKKQTGISKKDKAILSGENVIGIIEIKALDIKYPVLEGSGTEQMRYAIGHMEETAGIGEMGNCVLCGHNGSRNGIFFTHLNQIEAGDEVKLTDKKGELHRYAVSDTFIVGPYDNYVKKQTGEEILTLITCAERGTKRFICKCVPIEKAGEGDV